jgi:hypothetical protein
MRVTLLSKLAEHIPEDYVPPQKLIADVGRWCRIKPPTVRRPRGAAIGTAPHKGPRSNSLSLSRQRQQPIGLSSTRARE